MLGKRISDGKTTSSVLVEEDVFGSDHLTFVEHSQCDVVDSSYPKLSPQP